MFMNKINTKCIGCKYKNNDICNNEKKCIINDCKYDMADGYFIFEDFNACLTNHEISECVNESIDLDKVKRERKELLIKIYNFLGIEDFMKLFHILTNRCIDAYFDTSIKDSECDYHHCCECWEKCIRELIM